MVSVRPSVCPIRRLPQREAGLLLWARQVGDIVRLLQDGAAAANAGSATFTADVGSWGPIYKISYDLS